MIRFFVFLIFSLSLLCCKEDQKSAGLEIKEIGQTNQDAAKQKLGPEKTKDPKSSRPENKETTSASQNNEKPQLDHTKKSKIVVYRDRCMVTSWIKVNEKDHKIDVPGSIDPQSILFGQKGEENLSYEIAKESEKATEAKLILYPHTTFSGELTYGFTGINWHMHYVVELNNSFNEILSFSGFISIDNQSGASFDSANLRLIDGQTDSLAKNQSFTEYLVSLDQPLKKGKVIRVPWIHMLNQSTEQDYCFDVGGEYLSNIQGSEKHLPLQVYLSIKQSEERQKDLANGDLALYVRDDNGDLRFLGINQLKSTKHKDSIQFAIPLHLLTQLKSSRESPLSQVHGILEQTEFKTLITEKLEEAAYRFIIRNFGDKDLQIKVMLPFGDNYVKVVRQSSDHKKEGDRTVYWMVKVPSKTEVVLRYRIQLVKE